MVKLLVLLVANLESGKGTFYPLSFSVWLRMVMDDGHSTPLFGPLGKIFLSQPLYINDILIY